MDSCHLFNFLFGTKRATTELSKCFASMSERANARPSRATNRDSVKQCGQDNHQPTPPPSPLKQLQMRIASFASGSYTATKKADRKRSASSEAECGGTYRATLVQSTLDTDEEDPRDELISGADSTFAYKQADDKESRRPLVGNVNSEEQSNLRGHEDEIKPIKQQGAIKPLQVVQSEGFDAKGNSNESSDPVETIQANKISNNCKRVVLYDDSFSQNDNQQQQNIVSSAEVYNIVSEFGEARAKLRRVSLMSNDDRDYERDINCELKDKEIREKEEDKRAYLEEASSVSLPTRATCEIARDKRSVFVQSLVQSIELNGNFQGVAQDNDRRYSGPSSLNTDSNNNNNYNHAKQNRHTSKPILLVKSLPPKTPPKTNKAKCLNIQLSLNKPIKIQQLFQDEKFLIKFFANLEPLDRCKAAQVCRLWRNLLYSNRDYWKGLVNVIDCTQLRREHLVDCIISTLQTAKLKQQQQQRSKPTNNGKEYNQDWCSGQPIQADLSDKREKPSNGSLGFQQAYGNEREVPLDIDQEDVWRIQELCNRFAQRSGHAPVSRIAQQPITTTVDQNNNTSDQQQAISTTSKSSSIPSQISSTLSSVSLSSLLSPLSESSRIDSLKEKLYTSLDDRGFDAICLFGATDDDLEDLVNKIPIGAHKRITVGRLNNCSISDRGLELFVSTFNLIEELELSGCNEITNSFELKALQNLKRLIITDCINIADGFAQKLIEIVAQLDELTIQAYHLTDAFLEYLSLNADTSKLKRLELPNCKEITNQSLVTMAKHFNQLEVLSISGSTKISDEGVEILAEQSRKLKSLDLSWCSRITDASLECIACDLGDTLTDLILDRNVHITDIGLGYLATMSRLTLLHIRWCPRLTDVGLESVIALRSLKYLSIAGLHQVTARSLLCLVEADGLREVELTNCAAVNGDLLMFLTSKMPKCNIIF